MIQCHWGDQSPTHLPPSAAPQGSYPLGEESSNPALSLSVSARGLQCFALIMWEGPASLARGSPVPQMDTRGPAGQSHATEK
jgi:hypothetical protein